MEEGYLRSDNNLRRSEDNLRAKGDTVLGRIVATKIVLASTKLDLQKRMNIQF